jgi:hypothetical protein
MNEKLKCFISASIDGDLQIIKSILEELKIETIDLYDLSIANSIQQILKRKLRQADFAIFVLNSYNKSILYEIGVCEGLGKKYLIILGKETDIPFYLENKISVHANLNDEQFIRMAILGFIEEVKKNKRFRSKKNLNIEKYDDDIINNLKSFLGQIIQFRKYGGYERELEIVIKDVLETLKLKYAQNVKSYDKGIDFAIWNNKLGKVVGNPIIVEIKYGSLSSSLLKKAEEQIQSYVEKSEARVALLLYLDKSNQRFKVQSSLHPLIIAYDIEDFIRELLKTNFEDLILTYRNKIAHGLD